MFLIINCSQKVQNKNSLKNIYNKYSKVINITSLLAITFILLTVGYSQYNKQKSKKNTIIETKYLNRKQIEQQHQSLKKEHLNKDIELKQSFIEESIPNSLNQLLQNNQDKEIKDFESKLKDFVYSQQTDYTDQLKINLKDFNLLMDSEYFKQDEQYRLSIKQSAILQTYLQQLVNSTDYGYKNVNGDDKIKETQTFIKQNQNNNFFQQFLNTFNSKYFTDDEMNNNQQLETIQKYKESLKPYKLKINLLYNMIQYIIKENKYFQTSLLLDKLQKNNMKIQNLNSYQEIIKIIKFIINGFYSDNVMEELY